MGRFVKARKARRQGPVATTTGAAGPSARTVALEKVAQQLDAVELEGWRLGVGCPRQPCWPCGCCGHGGGLRRGPSRCVVGVHRRRHVRGRRALVPHCSRGYEAPAFAANSAAAESGDCAVVRAHSTPFHPTRLPRVCHSSAAGSASILPLFRHKSATILPFRRSSAGLRCPPRFCRGSATILPQFCHSASFRVVRPRRRRRRRRRRNADSPVARLACLRCAAPTPLLQPLCRQQPHGSVAAPCRRSSREYRIPPARLDPGGAPNRRRSA